MGLQRDTTEQLSTHIYTPHNTTVYFQQGMPRPSQPTPPLFNGPQQVPAPWQCGDKSWEHPAGAGVPATLCRPILHTHSLGFSRSHRGCAVSARRPSLSISKCPHSPHAEKKGLLKGTPRICLPEGKEQPLAQRWHSLGRCVKPLHPHRLTWGPGESKESQGGRHRHYEEGGPQGHSGRVSMAPHGQLHLFWGQEPLLEAQRGLLQRNRARSLLQRPGP